MPGRQLSLYLSDEEYDELQRWSQELAMAPNGLIRVALRMMLKQPIPSRTVNLIRDRDPQRLAIR